MRHVKLARGGAVDATALLKLIQTADTDMTKRLKGGIAIEAPSRRKGGPC